MEKVDFTVANVKLNPVQMVVKTHNGYKNSEVLEGIEFLRTLTLIRACKTIIASYLSRDEDIPMDIGHEIEAILETVDDLLDKKHATLDVLDDYYAAKREYELNNLKSETA